MPGPEAITRRDRIDPRLRAAGWRIVKYGPDLPLAALNACAVMEYPTESGPADYALVVRGEVLGVVEAKQTLVGPQSVLTQAERYSRGLRGFSHDFEGFHVPFIYSTNGEIIWYRDVRNDLNRSRRIAAFHTPDALFEILQKNLDSALARLLTTPNASELLYDYQIEANDEIEKAIAQRKRRLLVAMATGTGKTFMTVNEIYRLIKSGVAKRILFLVDRRALAAQAVRAFSTFEPEPDLKFSQIYEIYSQRFKRDDLDDDLPLNLSQLPMSYLLYPEASAAFVYVSTIQRMALNLFDEQASFGVEDASDEDSDPQAKRIDIPIHAFDLIVADECHRGYTSSDLSLWRATLEHFDAIQIGLTATPASHTTTYFQNLVYHYPYERAIKEGRLVDYDVVKIDSDVRINGVFLNAGEEVGYVNPDTGLTQLDLLEDQRQYGATEIEGAVTSPDSNAKVLQEVKRYAEEHEAAYGRFPKTLIFAANDLPHTSHADALVDLARDVFGRGDSFVQKITGRGVDRPLQRIREFRNRSKPGIVVTVDMLSTGVDIPDLEFIVLLRPIRSRILFTQMLGRGTRRGEFFPDKSHFTVFDCFGGSLLEYFRSVTDITIDPPRTPSTSIRELIANIWDNRDREFSMRRLIKRFQRIDKEMSGEARDLFSRFVAEGDLSTFARLLPDELDADFAGTMRTLRDTAFQDLLENYPRAPRTFLIAYETIDTVTSEWLVRGADGVDYKPEDYLIAFQSFIKAHADDIEAFRILLERPEGWRPEALNQLRNALLSAPQGFTIKNLQKAYHVTGHKALIDIISMIKQAVNTQAGLYTADERVEIAISRVTAGQPLSMDQREWLERIRQHLVENLTIDQDDFELIPILSRAGGFRQADDAFKGKLSEVIHELNEAIAA